MNPGFFSALATVLVGTQLYVHVHVGKPEAEEVDTPANPVILETAEPCPSCEPTVVDAVEADPFSWCTWVTFVVAGCAVFTAGAYCRGKPAPAAPLFRPVRIVRDARRSSSESPKTPARHPNRRSDSHSSDGMERESSAVEGYWY